MQNSNAAKRTRAVRFLHILSPYVQKIVPQFYQKL